MAQKALLVWCAGSIAICGSAALATTSLWRAPANQTGISASNDGRVTPDRVAAVPAPPVATEMPAPNDSFLSLAEVSFFDPRAAGASSLFRGALDPEPAPVQAPAREAAVAATAPEAAPEAPAAFVEVKPAEADAAGEADAAREVAPQQAVTVLPPPRPRFELARLEARRGIIGEVQPEQPAPGFPTPAPAPQTLPGWNWGEALRAPQTAQPSRPERVIHAGIASWYGPGFHGRKTASGERFDQNDMTAAHKTLPFGTRVKVVDEKTGRSIVVRINDRGPFKPGRVIDLSKQAAQALGMGGLASVKLVSAN